MKIVSLFEYNGITFVKTADNTLYYLHPVSETKLTTKKEPQSVESKNKNSKESSSPANLKSKITDTLCKLDISTNSKNFSRLVDAIYIVAANPTSEANLTQNVYCKLAKIHNITPSSINWGINTLIKQAQKNSLYNELFANKDEVFLKEFIVTIAKHVNSL